MQGWIAVGCALAAVGAAAWAEPAQAAERRVAWPTFVRTGPGEQYQVVEELLRGRTLDVQACDGAWCRAQSGRAVVYVKLAALDPAAPPPPQGAAAAGCFESGRAGYLGQEPFRYCPR